MNFSEAFIRRPIATLLLTLVLVFGGVVGWRQLPVASLPNVDFPTISVSATLSGASPDTMASSVAAPLEREFSTIAGLETITPRPRARAPPRSPFSSCWTATSIPPPRTCRRPSPGRSAVPEEMTTPPSFRKVNPADSPVVLLALSSPTVPLATLDDYAQTILLPRLSRLSGVAQVLVYGSQKFAVRIQMDPDALASRNIGVDELSTAIRRPIQLAAGGAEWPQAAIDLAVQRPVGRRGGVLGPGGGVARRRPGAPEGRGRSHRSVENNRTASWFNGTRPSCWRCSASPRPTRCRWSTTSAP